MLNNPCLKLFLHLNNADKVSVELIVQWVCRCTCEASRSVGYTVMLVLDVIQGTFFYICLNLLKISQLSETWLIFHCHFRDSF